MKFFIALTVAILCGCAGRIMEIQPSYDDIDSSLHVELSETDDSTPLCIYYGDERNSEYSNDIYLSRVYAKSWLQRAVEKSLSRQVIFLDRPENTVINGPQLTLKRAYFRQMKPAPVIAANVVLSLDERAEKPLYYRGQHVKTNWYNGKSEFEHSFDLALATALSKLFEDNRAMSRLQSLKCKSLSF